MEQRRVRRLIGGGMVAVGAVQAGWGVAGGDTVYALFGVFYAALGAVLLWRNTGTQ